jgi:SAM-dependent methyltransferase
VSPSQTFERWIRLGAALDWNGLFADRCQFERAFVKLLLDAPQLQGRVLDIGCGCNLPPQLRPLIGHYSSLDGIDPDPAIDGHPLLQRRWNKALEFSEAPDNAYDLAYSYNVVEHIANPRPFFERVNRLLRPGGIFWALTPNAVHPFAVLSRFIELIGLKSYARRKLGVAENGEMRVNDYPAYYRCNSPAAVQRAIRGLGFRKATYYFHPCVQWDNYFPSWLRWAPRAYDFALGSRCTPLMQVFMFRLEK